MMGYAVEITVPGTEGLVHAPAGLSSPASGHGVTILPCVVVGNGAVIGAGPWCQRTWRPMKLWAVCPRVT